MEYLPISLLILEFRDSNQRKLNGRYGIGAELFWWVGFRELGGVRRVQVAGRPGNKGPL